MHATVQDFFASLGSCLTPIKQAQLTIQEHINKDILPQCACLVLVPVSNALEQGWQIVVMVIKILFYGLQISVEIMNLLVAMVSMLTASLLAIDTSIDMYLGLFLGSI